MDYSGKLHEFILQVTAMEWNELNQQLEKLNNSESSVDEKYKALTWIAENANNVDIVELIEHDVVQNIILNQYCFLIFIILMIVSMTW